MKSSYEFITGNEAVVKGAIFAGAKVMFGYPITPSTEILEGWIKQAATNKNMEYLQTEDETAAGFALSGALLAGEKAFTATAGPGHILMQDPLSMAENLRLPFVCIVMQRGGPSTGTVNFSQQEVDLAAFGGNGDGLRVVYSASTVSELYTLAAKSFSTAWKHRFPTILLGDGHIAKMRTKVRLSPPIKTINASSILKEQSASTNLRNCYSSEKSFGEKLEKDIADWQASKKVIAECELFETRDASEIIFAHGSVAETVKEAVMRMRKSGRKIGLLRPITLRPLSTEKICEVTKKAKKAYVVESAMGQLARMIKSEVAGLNTPFVEINKPAQIFSVEEIIKKIKTS